MLRRQRSVIFHPEQIKQEHIPRSKENPEGTWVSLNRIFHLSLLWLSWLKLCVICWQCLFCFKTDKLSMPHWSLCPAEVQFSSVKCVLWHKPFFRATGVVGDCHLAGSNALNTVRTLSDSGLARSYLSKQTGQPNTPNKTWRGTSQAMARSPSEGTQHVQPKVSNDNSPRCNNYISTDTNVQRHFMRPVFTWFFFLNEIHNHVICLCSSCDLKRFYKANQAPTLPAAQPWKERNAACIKESDMI